MTALTLSLASLMLPLVSDLKAEDFTKVTIGDIVNDGGASIGASWAEIEAREKEGK